MIRKYSFLILVAVVVGLAGSPLMAAPDVMEIVKQCDNKDPGQTQIADLTITITEKEGHKKQTVYKRYWQAMNGQDDLVDKMTLFTMFPPDAKGAGFMRWAYTPESKKNAEQWIYLPVLRKIRRVSVRDQNDAFLGSDLTYGDITLRRPEDDMHKLLREETDEAGNEYYVVESVPREKRSIYDKKVNWYQKHGDMNNCVKVKVDYFAKKGSTLVKTQMLSWQKVGPAWVWDKVQVKNVQKLSQSTFELKSVQINQTIDPALFTERRLRKGL